MSAAQLTAAEVARLIDHTLLKPEATAADVEALIAEAVDLGTYSVCVSPTFAGLARRHAPKGLKVAAVCGFPSGKHSASVKAYEAAELAEDGVDEIDMVIDIGAAKAGLFAVTEGEIEAVRAAAPLQVLKVIIESAALTDEEIVGVCKAAEAANADFVKTSTGFHPAGGASVHAVELMHATVPDLQVKASGGIRTWEQAVAMVGAGATRLGVSSSRAILGGTAAEGDY